MQKFSAFLVSILIAFSLIVPFVAKGQLETDQTPITAPVTPPITPPDGEQTPTPTPTSKPEKDKKPVVTTKYIFKSLRSDNFNFSVKGYDINENESLVMDVNGLPEGIDESDCSEEVRRGRKYLSCSFEGSISGRGIRKFTATLTDDKGLVDNQNIYILSFRFPSLPSLPSFGR